MSMDVRALSYREILELTYRRVEEIARGAPDSVIPETTGGRTSRPSPRQRTGSGPSDPGGP